MYILIQQNYMQEELVVETSWHAFALTAFQKSPTPRTNHCWNHCVVYQFLQVHPIHMQGACVLDVHVMPCCVADCVHVYHMHILVLYWSWFATYACHLSVVRLQAVWGPQTDRTSLPQKKSNFHKKNLYTSNSTDHAWSSCSSLLPFPSL